MTKTRNTLSAGEYLAKLKRSKISTACSYYKYHIPKSIKKTSSEINEYIMSIVMPEKTLDPLFIVSAAEAYSYLRDEKLSNEALDALHERMFKLALKHDVVHDSPTSGPDLPTCLYEQIKQTAGPLTEAAYQACLTKRDQTVQPCPPSSSPESKHSSSAIYRSASNNVTSGSNSRAPSTYGTVTKQLQPSGSQKNPRTCGTGLPSQKTLANTNAPKLPPQQWRGSRSYYSSPATPSLVSQRHRNDNTPPARPIILAPNPRPR